jgi:hypothetical protein
VSCHVQFPYRKHFKTQGLKFQKSFAGKIESIRRNKATTTGKQQRKAEKIKQKKCKNIKNTKQKAEEI